MARKKTAKFRDRAISEGWSTFANASGLRLQHALAALAADRRATRRVARTNAGYFKTEDAAMAEA